MIRMLAKTIFSPFFYLRRFLHFFIQSNALSIVIYTLGNTFFLVLMHDLQMEVYFPTVKLLAVGVILCMVINFTCFVIRTFLPYILLPVLIFLSLPSAIYIKIIGIKKI